MNEYQKLKLNIYLWDSWNTKGTSDWIRQDKGSISDWLKIINLSRTNDAGRKYLDYLIFCNVLIYVKTINKNGAETRLYKMTKDSRYILEEIIANSEITKLLEKPFNLTRKISVQIGLK